MAISHDDNSFFEDLLETKLNKMIKYQHTSSLEYQGTSIILRLLQNGNNWSDSHRRRKSLYD